MWNNVKGKYVKNTSDKGGGENSFPIVGPYGTTYAGEYNPKNTYTGDDDYSQPPQNMADFVGLVHDKLFDKKRISGFNGTISRKSDNANKYAIYMSKQVIQMYKRGVIDPYTGMPITKKTMETAKQIRMAFEAAQSVKK